MIRKSLVPIWWEEPFSRGKSKCKGPGVGRRWLGLFKQQNEWQSSWSWVSEWGRAVCVFCACWSEGGDRGGGQETRALAAAIRAAIQGRGDSSEQGRVGRRGHSRDPFWRPSQLLLQTEWMWGDQGGTEDWKVPGRREWQPTPVFLPGELGLDTTERFTLSLFLLLR